MENKTDKKSVEQLAQKMNALAFKAAGTDGWESAAPELVEARDTLRALLAENEALEKELER